MRNMNQQLILVNENDEEVGFGEKLSVHQNAQLHRAFSLFPSLSAYPQLWPMIPAVDCLRSQA